VSVLDAQLPPGDEQDELAAALLGARARLRRTQRLLARPAPPGTPPADLDDPVVLAALGWIALHRRLAQHLAAAASPIARDDGAEPTDRARRPPGLLR
jgi:hypothetical protein